MKALALCLLFALPVFAQAPVIPGLVPDPEEEGPGPVAPVGIPDPDAIAVGVGQVFNYENLTGQEAANLYHKHTGKRVIVQGAAGQAELKITQPGPLTNAELSSILEKQLLLEGFALIPSGENEVKLVIANGPTDPTGAGPQVLGPGDELPDTDQFLTYVMQLQYLKPEEALRAFTGVVGNYGPGGKVAAVPNAASVVINANTALIRSLIALKKRIDVPSSQVATKFVEVTYADVEELGEKLNDIFNNQSQQNSSAGVQRTTGNQNAGAAQIPGLVQGAPGGGTAAGEDTPVNILPDTRTNRLFLMGRPVDLIFIEGLIEDFDSPSSKRNFLRHKMRYLPVVEFLPVAANALERTLETGTAGGGASGLGSSAGGSRGSTNRTGGASNNRSNTSTGIGGGNTGNTGGSRAELTAQDVNTAPESLLVGKTLLVADNISNSIIVQGPPHHVEIVENLIAELDQPSQQVAITAVFGRYDVTEGGSFGVDLGKILGDATGNNWNIAGQSRNGVPSVIDPNTLTDLSGLLGASGAAGNGLSLYGVLDNEFGVFVNAVESNSDFVAISRPTVFTTNNHEARISSGARIAVPTSTFTGNNVSGGQSTNVEFRDVVLELAVLPLVNDENTVTLQVSLVRDDIGEDRSIGELIVPDIITDELTTTVTVPNRSTIILGGLITETDRNSKSGIPILMNIPGLGRLFSRTTDALERQELVIMIHPSIITNDYELYDYQREYDAKSKVSTDARATQGGVLPPRGMVAAPLYDKGDTAPAPVASPAPPAPAPAPRVARPAVVTSPSQQAREKVRTNALKNRRRR